MQIFIADVNYTKSLLNLLKKHDFSWICQVSTNIFRHEDLIAGMSKAGCNSVYMGIETFSEENLAVKRPGTGVSPMRWDEIVGQCASKDYKKDDLI